LTTLGFFGAPGHQGEAHMQYTDDKIKCRKCGKISISSSRYCDVCGGELHIPLDSQRLKEADFIDIFNSTYSLIANEKHPDRNIYLPKNLEGYILKRGNICYKQLWEHTISYRTHFKGLGEPLNQDIEPYIVAELQFSKSTILAGYSFRIAEELYTGKKTQKISEKEIERLINNYKMKYADKNDEEELCRLELLSYALCYDENYSNYYLLQKAELEDTLFGVVGQSAIIEINIKTDFYRTLCKSDEIGQKFIDKNREQYFWETFSDFIYGYCLRISSLQDLIP
jgi:hypothetical protein